MIPWRRRLIESSLYHWCALIHPIKIFNLLSPILKGWAGKGSCQKAPSLSISLSLSSSQLHQCSWQNPTPKIRVLFPVISGLILIWFNPCTDRFDSSCLFMHFCRPSLRGQSDYRLRGAVFSLLGPISTQACKCTYSTCKSSDMKRKV